MTAGPFTLDTYMAQIDRARRIGPMQEVLSSIPGMSQRLHEMKMSGADIERQMDRMRAIYCATTPAERLSPDLLDDARCSRVGRGAGVSPDDVRALLHQFRQMREMMDQIRNRRHNPPEEPGS